MQGLAYNTTTILYHNKLSNIHDLASYYQFLKYAWVDHAALMIGMLCAGAICGMYVAHILILKKLANK